ncbi:MAG: DUF523 domain-containing protein [Oscillospiraceae bacterium]|nr:DUF523 domain-containing protein [Oscillospiraceae bacterium]
MKILISACLLGIACRYDGKSKEYNGIRMLMERHQLIPVCPECYGGLPTPRPPAERQGDRVCTQAGMDVTAQYEKGAREALKLAEQFGCTWAILKEKSPSCGSGEIYDGTFSRSIIPGDGITAALLKENGIRVVGERQLDLLPEE